jgi:hypothetical protein
MSGHLEYGLRAASTLVELSVEARPSFGGLFSILESFPISKIVWCKGGEIGNVSTCIQLIVTLN